ncbi:MAG: cell division/cell wall cluster transcriptional repressor MraZ [Bacillota bacterium]
MFSGNQEQKLDDRGRLRLPAKFRGELGKSFAITKGHDNMLIIYSQEEFQQICEKMSKYDQYDLELQRAVSDYISGFEQLEEDAQGRFVIPPKMRAYAGIDKNVYIKGVLKRIEIMSLEKHQSEEAKLDPNQLMNIFNRADKAMVAQNG